MVQEPDEIHLQSERKPTNYTNFGYTSEEALKILGGEIDEVVDSFETKFHRER